ncbi:MAG: N-acetyltransferase [Rhodanobacteraceae bacterium]|nr:MAG: N-acetyltransferase [Rhodanobacteraceae bacterium]
MATRIRPFRDGDLVAIDAVNRAAFGRADEGQLVAALHTAGCDAFELVAERDARIVAHILFSPVTVEHGDDGRVLGLAPLAVAPGHQRQGIGSALVRAALSTLATGPYRAVVVLGDPDYYQRFGFGPASAAGLHDVYAAGDDFMALALRAGGLSGYRGRVSYAPEFDGLE